MAKRQAETAVQQVSVRMDRALYEQLRFVSESLEVSMNTFVQRAVAAQVRVESSRLVKELSPRLQKLQEYARNPQGLSAELEAVELGEAKYGAEDPAEGTSPTTT